MARATYQDCRRLLSGVNLFSLFLQGGAINGYAVGRKRVAGEATELLAIIVYVSAKTSLGRLPLDLRIPQTLSVPDGDAEGGVIEFVTDVQEARFAALALTRRMRPAPGGASLGHRDVTAGTLGGLVRDADSGEVLILSNNHVMANVNDALIGDPVLQPAPTDGGVDPDDRLATLSGFVEIDFSPGAENSIDAAVAAPLNLRDVLFETVDIGPDTPAEVRAITEADLGRFVHKTGRTTEHTQGFIQAIFGTVSVDYGLMRSGTFTDQIIVSQSPAEEVFSDGGDSGSLVYDADNRCIGLLFAGSAGRGEAEPGRTIINPIDRVLAGLGLELLAPGELRPADA